MYISDRIAFVWDWDRENKWLRATAGRVYILFLQSDTPSIPTEIRKPTPARHKEAMEMRASSHTGSFSSHGCSDVIDLAATYKVVEPVRTVDVSSVLRRTGGITALLRARLPLSSDCRRKHDAFSGVDAQSGAEELFKRVV